MPFVGRIKVFDIPGICRASHILHACGKDMARRFDLHHWDNPRAVTFAIAGLGCLKNEMYLVRDGDRPVATFQIKKNGQDMHLTKLATLPDAAGRGIGSFCLEHVEALALKAGCDRIVLEVYDRSGHAIDFYHRRGFKDVGRVSTRKYTEIEMEKAVSRQA